MRYFRLRFLFSAILGCSALAGLGTTWAADPNDVRLTLESRQSLNADAKLAGLNLGVTVKAGVATLFGPVPSEELARRAEARVRVVNGLQNVRNDLHVAPPTDPDERRLAQAIEQSEPVKQNVPDPIVTLDPSGKAVMPPKPPHASTPPVSSLFSLAKSDPPPTMIAPVQGQNPTGRGPIPPVMIFANEQPNSPGPARGIEKLQQDSRFHGLNATCAHGVVTISGVLKKWSDLWEFADAVANLPGVDRVRIERVQQE